MATTSPDNIYSPDSDNQYALVQDLGAMADSVQDALESRANVYKGTTAQRISFLSTATPGVLWQDTDGIGMLWKRSASAWVPAVWRWSGTTAQMNGFTQAPNGFEWYNTTTGSEHLRLGGSWVNPGRPYAMAQGQITLTPPSGGGTINGTITFPSGRFTTEPVVHATLQTGGGPTVTVNVNVSSITATSASVSLSRSNGTATTINWLAIQMTSSDASG